MRDFVAQSRPSGMPSSGLARERVWLAVRVAITVAVMTYVLRDVELSAAGHALARFPLSWTMGVLALVAADRVLMLWRWLLLIRPFTQMSGADLTRIFLVSSFVGSFLPAGVGGDAARAFSVGRRTGRSGEAVASVVVDRWLGLLAVGLLGCAGLLTTARALPDQARAVTVAATLLLLTGSVAGLFADRVVQWMLPESMRRSWLGRLALKLTDAISAYRQHGGALMRVAGLSVAVQALRVVLAWVLGRGLGIEVPFLYYWVFMPLNILVVLLPLSIGGFGLPQGTMIWTLGPLGVDPTPAFLLSSLFVGIGILGNLPGAFLYLRGPASRLPAASDRGD